MNECKLHDPVNSELYAYDSAYRLIDFRRGTLNAGSTAITTPTATTNTLQTRDWKFDGVGNWKQDMVLREGAISQTESRQHTNFNEIASEGSESFDYDPTGNLITDDRLLYQWDALNRLRTVTRNSDDALIATYTYDCQNRRMRKVVTNSGSLDGGTDFYYSGWRVCEEHDFDGANESLKYQYVWGATYHDELVVRDDRQSGGSIAELNNSAGSGRQFQHHNTLFSIFAVTDESGAVLEHYQYDPYGKRTIFDPSFNQLTLSAVEGEFTYTSQRYDAESDLYYYKNRYYSSDQGRFLTRDPIGYRDGLNLYAGYFAMWLATDPLGLASPGSHHIIPQAVWNSNRANPIGFSSEVQRIFDQARMADPEHGYTRGHRAYNAAIRETAENYIRSLGIRSRDLTPDHARELIRRVRTSTNPNIQNYLNEIRERQRSFGRELRSRLRFPASRLFTGLLNGLSFIPGILEDLERFARWRNSDLTMDQILAEEFHDSPTLITPYGVIENPWYGCHNL